MAKNVNSYQANVIFVDLEEEGDDEVIELLPPLVHSEQIQNAELDKTSETIPNLQQNESQDNSTLQPDRKKIIQQCLALLLHSQKCDIVQEEMSEVQIQCVHPQCSTIKKLLKHQETCTMGQECTVQRCSSSKMILTHWSNCKREDCQLCSPLRRSFSVQSPPETGEPQESPINASEELPRLNTDSDIQFSSSFPSFSRTEMNEHVSPGSHLVPNIFASRFTGVSNTTPNFHLTPFNSPPIAQLQEQSCSLPSTPRNREYNRSKRNYNYSSKTLASPRWKTFPNHRFPFSGSRSHSQGSYRKPFNSRSNRSSRNSQSNSNERIRPTNQLGPPFQPQYRNASSSQMQSNQSSLTFSSRNQKSDVQFNDLGTKKMIQYQVMMLIHACKCQKRQEQNIGAPCTSQACRVTKTLLDHVRLCKNTARCSFRRCISSKRLLLHLDRCTREDCSLCSPLRKKCYAFCKARGGSSTNGRDRNGSFRRSQNFAGRGSFGSQRQPETFNEEL